MILFFFPMSLSAFTLLGKWKPPNHHEFTIHVEKETVCGIMNKNPYIEMNLINKGHDLIELNDIKIIRKPPDWYNIKKYQQYIQIFKKIKEDDNRVICNFVFLEQDILLIEPQIGEEKYKFILCRI